MSIPFTSDMLALAQEVIEKKCPVTAAALADCVSENVNHPDFRFERWWVERLEFTIRVWRERLMSNSKWSLESKGFVIPEHTYISFLRDYQSLQADCKEVFDREVASE